jgi:hypothetical protein
VSLYLTQLASDNFQRANENPLNPTIWTPVQAQSGEELQIISDQCTGTFNSNTYFGSEQYTGISWPNNQWAEITLGAYENLAGFSEVGIVLRAPLYPTGSSAFYILTTQIIAGGTQFNLVGPKGTILQPTGPAISTGDTILTACVGSALYVFHNGTLLGSSNDTSVTSGYAGTLVKSAFSGATGLTNFVGGLCSLGPTIGSIIQGTFANLSNNSNPVMGALPQNSRGQLDLIQIISTGGQVVWKLDYTGTVTVNPTSWTRGTILGQFFGASWSAAFQQNNTNPYDLDILQIRDTGGQIVWWLDYTGTVQFPSSSLPTN